MPIRDPGPGKTGLGRRARPGNRNARKGFYSQAISEADRALLDEAAAIFGLDDEIALLRLRIHELTRNEPDNVPLQMSAINTLARLLKARYQLSAEQRSSLKEALFKVLTEVAIPLGIKFLPGGPR
ncbi:MAG: hypothetical protein HY688_04590 [Chloroflexi bacterium]|nr:hypothetical protein [Chloroflexota bacterium]